MGVGFLLLVVWLINAGCATQRYLDQARSAALRGEPVQARYYYEQALLRDPGLTQNERFTAEYRVVQRDAALRQGDLAMGENQPIVAAEAYALALSLDPGNTAARDGLEQAQQQAADGLVAKAIELAERGEADQAREHLEEALVRVPGHPHAASALRSDTLPAAEQPAAYREALLHAEAGRWEDAFSKLETLVLDQPYFMPARDAIHGFRSRARQDLLATAQAALTRDDADAAEATLHRLDAIEPGLREVRQGLADAQIIRGDQLRAAGKPGAALLAYRRAVDTDPDAAVLQRISAIEAELRATHRVLYHVQPDRGSVEDADVADRVVASLTRPSAYPIALDVAGIPVTVSLADVVIPVVQTQTTAERHYYQVPTPTPNPEIDALESRLAFLDSQIRFARYSYGPNRYRFGYNDCGRYGSVRYGRSYRYDRLVREYRRTAATLARTPRTVTVYHRETWHYNLSTHTRRSSAEMRYRMGDAPARAITATFRESDTSIDRPNAEIGLPADEQLLSSEQPVRERLIAEGSEKLAASIGRALTQSRISELREQSRSAEDQGNPDAAVEARVAAAVLMEAIDPTVSRQWLIAAAR